MKSLALAGLFMCALVVTGCAEPDPAATHSTTSSAAATSTLTASTTTPSTAPPTTTASTTTSSTSITTIPVEGPAPEIELKPPGHYAFVPLDDGGDYFIFEEDISTSHTTRFSTGLEGDGYSMTARVDGDLAHFIATEEMGGETLTNGGKTWVRGEDGQWVIDEEWVANLEGFQLPTFTLFATPDVVYSTAYAAFDAMEFDGWIGTGSETLAVFRGGPEAVALTYDAESDEGGDDFAGGSIEVWWSSVGYFRMVRVTEDAGYGIYETKWTITDVGTTEVEPPPSSGAG